MRFEFGTTPRQSVTRIYTYAHVLLTSIQYYPRVGDRYQGQTDTCTDEVACGQLAQRSGALGTRLPSEVTAATCVAVGPESPAVRREQT